MTYSCNMWLQRRWGTKLYSCLKQISRTYLFVSHWFMGLLRQSRMQPGWGTGVSRKCARFCKKRAGGGLWGVRTISGHWGYSTPQSWTFLETVGNRISKWKRLKFISESSYFLAWQLKNVYYLLFCGSFLSVGDKWRLCSVLCKWCSACVFWGLAWQAVVTHLSGFLTTSTCFYKEATTLMLSHSFWQRDAK